MHSSVPNPPQHTRGLPELRPALTQGTLPAFEQLSQQSLQQAQESQECAPQPLPVLRPASGPATLPAFAQYQLPQGTQAEERSGLSQGLDTTLSCTLSRPRAFLPVRWPARWPTRSPVITQLDHSGTLPCFPFALVSPLDWTSVLAFVP